MFDMNITSCFLVAIQGIEWVNLWVESVWSLYLTEKMCVEVNALQDWWKLIDSVNLMNKYNGFCKDMTDNDQDHFGGCGWQLFPLIRLWMWIKINWLELFSWLTWCTHGHRQILDVRLPLGTQLEKLHPSPFIPIYSYFQWVVRLGQTDQSTDALYALKLGICIARLLLFLPNLENSFGLFLLGSEGHWKGMLEICWVT